MDIDRVIEALNKRGFEGIYVSGKADVLPLLDRYIEKGQSVGIGGSMTMGEIGVQDYLLAKGCTVYGFGYYDGIDMYQHAYAGDWYLSSSNAITEGGELVNIDGRSNRISAIAGGPKNVLIIAGINKITPTLEDAIYRVRNVAAPLNAKRLGRKTPCAVTGKCSDCNSPDNICRNTLISHHPSTGKRVVVVLVGENLGY